MKKIFYKKNIALKNINIFAFEIRKLRKGAVFFSRLLLFVFLLICTEKIFSELGDFSSCSFLNVR